jgi:Flp pilus assembly protein TadG
MGALRHLVRLIRDRRGLAAVEFALTLPFLLLI